MDIQKIKKISEIFKKEFPGAKLLEIEIEGFEKKLIMEAEGFLDGYEVEVKYDLEEDIVLGIQRKSLTERRKARYSLKAEIDLANLKIGYEKALEILKENKTPDRIKEMELEMENTTPIWEIEFYSEGDEWEIEINAETGEVLELEKD